MAFLFVLLNAIRQFEFNIFPTPIFTDCTTPSGRIKITNLNDLKIIENENEIYGNDYDTVNIGLEKNKIILAYKNEIICHTSEKKLGYCGKANLSKNFRIIEEDYNNNILIRIKSLCDEVVENCDMCVAYDYISLDLIIEKCEKTRYNQLFSIKTIDQENYELENQSENISEKNETCKYLNELTRYVDKSEHEVENTLENECNGSKNTQKRKLKKLEETRKLENNKLCDTDMRKYIPIAIDITDIYNRVMEYVIKFMKKKKKTNKSQSSLCSQKKI